MKELREEAKRQESARLRKYGADRAYASGGKVDKWEGSRADKTLDAAQKKIGVKEGSKTDEAIDRAMHKRADGGPIAGSAGPKLGRGRSKGGKKGTQVNVIIASKGGDTPPPALPLALGAGPAPVNIPPKPMPPVAAGPLPPPEAPGMPPPRKCGGAVKK